MQTIYKTFKEQTKSLMDFKYKKLKTCYKSNIILLTILYHFNIINTIVELFMKSKKRVILFRGGKKSPSNILPLFITLRSLLIFLVT